MDHLRNLRDSVEFGQSSLDPRRTSPPSGRSFGSAYFSTGSPSLGRAADVLDADDAQSVLGNLKLSGDHGNSRDFSLSSTAKEDPVGWPSQHHATGHLRKRLWRDVDPDDDDDGTDEEVEGESHRSPFEQGSNFAKPLKFSQPSVFRTSSSQAGTSKQPLELGPQQFFRPEVRYFVFVFYLTHHAETGGNGPRGPFRVKVSAGKRRGPQITGIRRPASTEEESHFGCGLRGSSRNRSSCYLYWACLYISTIIC
ncbi:hypothetical protein DFJ73DRAFT_205911 [Zopfochytrium polystomum]|nr:hypothetical protein DFJ73DRAFT_205911 [Zopfochytrium polystomum]